MIFFKLSKLIEAHRESAGKPPSEIVLCEEWMAELLDELARKKLLGEKLVYDGIPVRLTNDSDGVYSGFKAITKH